VVKDIVWTEFASNELKSIYEYYKVQASVAVAKKIKSKIFESTKNLSEQPLIGQIEENLKELNQNHRYIVEGNYKIIYLVVKNTVYITDVFDCRQNPEKMKR
jgi:toxin ParE1/3/4